MTRRAAPPTPNGSEGRRKDTQILRDRLYEGRRNAVFLPTTTENEMPLALSERFLTSSPTARNTHGE